jgi:hypothetical protein
MSPWALVELVLAGAVATVAYHRARWLRERQMAARMDQEDDPPCRIEELKDGERARVIATVREASATYTSPVTERACIAYHFVIDERSSAGAGAIWMPVAEQTMCAPSFTLVEGSAELSVYAPFRLALDFDDAGEVWANLPPGVFRVLDQVGISLSAPFWRDRQFRFREAVLKPGDRVAVSGRVAIEVAAGGAREELRGPPLRRSLRGSPDQPVIVVDADDAL